MMEKVPIMMEKSQSGTCLHIDASWFLKERT
eukprot:CAMPEP_0172175840 /NCGR_PEP_ID=MMETSP1050-20130122/14461_1 /TAXON_ID=233186 /ORGANISM="Cryptomonas curvata, Strain CCAP979/52" /LENGTH=30 /DNA_ID= /DNA_START= /DNA_END= /DNA_ORIENTATION=